MKEGDNELGWMLVEVKGFRKLAGRVTETTLAGHGVIRVEVPGEGEEFVLTQLYPPDSIHCLTYCTEAEARRQAAGLFPEPVKRLESPEWPTPRYEDIEEEEDDVSF